MKLICLSDLHGDTIPAEKLPSGDVLVIAGDVLADDYQPAGRDIVGTNRIQRQGWWHDEVLVPWLESLTKQYPDIIVIGGNHDFLWQAVVGSPKFPPGVHYLNEKHLMIDGVKFYGAPWNCTAGWAFYLDDPEGFEEKLPYIADDIDVLIVHGPPGGLSNMPGFHWCAKALGSWVASHPLKAVICGHIHEAYGQYDIGSTPVYVVSSKNGNYQLVNPPMEVEIN